MNKYEKDIKKKRRNENIRTTGPLLLLLAGMVYVLFGKPSQSEVSEDVVIASVLILGIVIIGGLSAMMIHLFHQESKLTTYKLQEHLMRNFEINDTYVLTIFQPSDGKVHIYTNKKENYDAFFESQFNPIDVNHDDSIEDINDKIDQFFRDRNEFADIKEIQVRFKNKGEIIKNMLNLKSR